MRFAKSVFIARRELLNLSIPALSRGRRSNGCTSCAARPSVEFEVTSRDGESAERRARAISLSPSALLTPLPRVQSRNALSRGVRVSPGARGHSRRSWAVLPLRRLRLVLHQLGRPGGMSTASRHAQSRSGALWYVLSLVAEARASSNPAPSTVEERSRPRGNVANNSSIQCQQASCPLAILTRRARVGSSSRKLGSASKSAQATQSSSPRPSSRIGTVSRLSDGWAQLLITLVNSQHPPGRPAQLARLLVWRLTLLVA